MRMTARSGETKFLLKSEQKTSDDVDDDEDDDDDDDEDEEEEEVDDGVGGEAGDEGDDEIEGTTEEDGAADGLPGPEQSVLRPDAGPAQDCNRRKWGQLLAGSIFLWET